MGLSERKNKQRIGHDPRNLTWSDDKTRFSYKHMQNLGWSDNTGIGRGLDGNPNHIAVVHRMDNSGIGMARARKEGDDQAAGAGQAGRGLEDVLKRLAGSASASPSPMPASPAPPSAEDVARTVRNRNASRQKHLNAKRLASASNTALAEILGVNAASLPASVTSTPAAASPQPSTGVSTPKLESQPATPEPEDTESINKSNLSVSDYFRMRMREKMQARQAASGSTPAAEMDLSAMNFGASTSKPVGGTAWEGSKMTFGEDAEQDAESSKMAQEASASSSDSASPTPAATTTGSDVKDKAARKAEKEAKKAAKAAKKTEKEAKRVAKAEKKQAKSDAKAGVTDTQEPTSGAIGEKEDETKKSSKRTQDNDADREKPKKRKRDTAA